MTASQLGKTAALLSVLGKRFADGPRAPALVVMESQKKAREISTERIRQLIDTCEQLDALHAKGKRDSVFEKWIAGSPLRLAWAGSAGSLASHPVGLLLMDEVDRWVENVGNEGDPIRIAKARVKMYLRHLIVITSSPTFLDASRIQSEFDLGSMEIAQWACAACGHYHAPRSEYLVTPKEGHIEDRADGARYKCPQCTEELDESAHRAMIDSVRMWPYERRDGDLRYVPRAEPEIRHRHRSFWISGFHSPMSTFSKLAFELLSATESYDANEIRACLNTQFGELYEGSGERPELSVVRSHMGDYAPGTVPYGVQYITAGVDVQRSELVYVVRGWGAQLGQDESWLIECGKLPGDPRYDDVWLALDRVIDRLGVHYGLIDSGFNPSTGELRPQNKIHDYCKRRPTMYAAKGHRHRSTPVTVTAGSVSMTGRKIQGEEVRNLDVTVFRQWLYHRIAATEFEEVVDLWHLPRELPAEYAAEVVAEEWIAEGTTMGHYFCPRHRSNHYGDCEVYATAAWWHRRANVTLQALPELEAQPEPSPRADSTPREGIRPQVRPGFERRTAF